VKHLSIALTLILIYILQVVFKAARRTSESLYVIKFFDYETKQQVASVGSAGNWPKYNSDLSPVIFLNLTEAQTVRNLAIEALYMCVLVSRCVANIYSFREFREFVIFVQL